MIERELAEILIKFSEDESYILSSKLDVNILSVNLRMDDLLPCVTLLAGAPYRFTILTDLFAADFPERNDRFEIVYNLLSLQNNCRVILKIQVADGVTPTSIVSIFHSAAWYEREIFDMFGVKFAGNKDMRRILTDYGFVGHPLRKDFPLTGHVELRYDEGLEKVVYGPVSLKQEYREFNFLHGDEKVAKK